MISLRKKSIVEDGLVGVAMIATGLALIFSTNKTIAIVLLTISILTEVIPYLLIIRKKKDIEDELSKANRARAAESTLTVVTLLLLIFAVCLLIMNNSVSIRFEHVWIAFGLVKIIRCAFFCLYDTYAE